MKNSLKTFLFPLALFIAFGSFSFEMNTIEQANKNASLPPSSFHSYTAWTAFLTKHVKSNGQVNYAGIKGDMKTLNNIILDFQNNTPSSSWSRNEKLAYWINAYNLFTLKLVATNYPVQSIKDITAKPWDKKFIVLAGSNLSLNDIEHKKIRGKFNEPRIHFALNCASYSCPQLLNKAYTPNTLGAQLVQQTKSFLSNKKKNDFSNENEIKISKLFSWYKEDFTKGGGTVIDFINKHRASKLKNPQVKYLEYSWKLNN